MPTRESDLLQLKDAGTVAFYWRAALRPYPRQTTAILLLMVGGAMLEAVTIGLTVPLLDAVVAPQRLQHGPIGAMAASTLQAIGLPATTNVVTFALLGLASLLFVLRSAFLVLHQCTTAAVAVRLRRTVKTALFEKFLHARYEAIARRSRGTIVHDINAPAESFAGAITQLGYFLSGIVTSLCMVALLLFLSWWVTILIGLLALASVQGWRRYADRRAAASGRVLYELRSEQHRLQVDAIDGLKIVKAHTLEPRMVQRQDERLAGELQPELRLVFFRNGPLLVNELLAVALVIGLGAATFLVPGLGIRFSMLGAFLLAIRRLAPSLSMINTASVHLNNYKRNLEVMGEVLEAIPQERQGGRSLGELDAIRLEGVSFAYASRPSHHALRDVTATMPRGTVTAIVGPTGSGKSTIAYLLLGFDEPSSGSVRANGVPLLELDLAAWRRRIGYVPQDVFVFNTTIRENLALGDEAVAPDQVEWAARIAQIHEFIGSLPEGYETVVGDRGVRLSGGQCQRLAIARAILRRPDVLIFDEATSALDPLTERAVYEAIGTLRREAIVIVISHRLSTVKDANQILVVRAGRVVETGTHTTLLREGGTYAALYAEGDRAAAQLSAA